MIKHNTGLVQSFLHLRFIYVSVLPSCAHQKGKEVVNLY